MKKFVGYFILIGLALVVIVFLIIIKVLLPILIIGVGSSIIAALILLALKWIK